MEILNKNRQRRSGCLYSEVNTLKCQKSGGNMELGENYDH